MPGPYYPSQPSHDHPTEELPNITRMWAVDGTRDVPQAALVVQPGMGKLLFQQPYDPYDPSTYVYPVYDQPRQPHPGATSANSDIHPQQYVGAKQSEAQESIKSAISIDGEYFREQQRTARGLAAFIGALGGLAFASSWWVSNNHHEAPTVTVGGTTAVLLAGRFLVTGWRRHNNNSESALKKLKTKLEEIET